MTTKKKFTESKTWNILSILLAVVAVVSGIASDSFEHWNNAYTKNEKHKIKLSSPEQREIIIPAEQDQVIQKIASDNVIGTNDTIIPQNIAPSINKDTIKSKDIMVVSQTPSSLTEENKNYILDKIAELQATWPHLKCIEVSTVTGNEQSYKLGTAVLNLLKSEHLMPQDAATEQNVYGKSVKGIRIVVSGNCIVVEINEV